MTDEFPPIYFYIPQNDWPNLIPKKVDQLRPATVLETWILQTYLRLRESGFTCQLVEKMPEEGIVVAYRYSLPYESKPAPKVLWVCVKGDQNPHPYAHINVVQNPRELEAPPLQIQSVSEDRYLLAGKRFYLPHWPQAGIIPRDPARGDTFENVVYFGISYNLAPELRVPEWQEQLEAMGLRWRLQKNRNIWNDFSEVDVILAARSFDGQSDYPWKPASKLYNAWNAEVPAILGRESAFQGERKSDLDYIEVNSYQETIAALQRLRDDKQLRRAMAENCRRRAREIVPENIAKRWRDFLIDICVPAYEGWRTADRWQRQQFFVGRYLALKWNAMERRARSLSLKILK